MASFLKKFQRLRWKFTMIYTVFTVLAFIILELPRAVRQALDEQAIYRSDQLELLVAENLQQIAPQLGIYLARQPLDLPTLENWIASVARHGELSIKMGQEAHFFNVLLVDIFDAEGQPVFGKLPDPEKAEMASITQLPDPAWIAIDLVLRCNTLLKTPEALWAYLEDNPELHETADGVAWATRLDDGNILAIAPILGDDDQLLGALAMVLLTSPMANGELFMFLLYRVLWSMALLTPRAVLIGLVFGLVIAWLMAQRLKVLDEAVAAWGQGDFETRARDFSGDELGQLARRLNQMAEQLGALFQTRQALAAVETRNHLARELHDSVKQQLFATVMQLGAARVALSQDPQACAASLAEAETLARQAQNELSTLIRELRPAGLDEKGLGPALQAYVADWARHSRIKARVRLQGERPLPLALEQALFRVTQESLANISKHSQATEVDIHLAWEADQVELSVQDNGQGFTPRSKRGQGLGLQSMAERMSAIAGYFHLESQPGQGTRIQATCPIPEEISL